MGDNFKKVQSGRSLRIPAEAFNAFIDAARDFRDRQQSRGTATQPQFRQSGIVRVKNGSGADRNRFEILGIDRPIFTPSDSLDSFQNEVLLVGVTPDGEYHAGRFCVLLEPLAANAIGLAVISGVCPVRVNITEASDSFAEVQDNDVTQLKTVGSGSATILWKEPGTGEDKWAVVRLGDAQPVIRKAEMIETLRQGDVTSAKAWLLKYEDGVWQRTEKKIDLWGALGFRGVAFGRTAGVDVGDFIDVYYSHDSKQWYGVVGAWYFHGDVVADIGEGEEGEVKLNVGAGADAREITVPAFSPYGAVRQDDFVSVSWNTFSQHWDIGKFLGDDQPGCALERVDDPGSLSNGKLRVDIEMLAGLGLEPQASEAECHLNVKPSCGIAVDEQGVRVNNLFIAGQGLEPEGDCLLKVAGGCGIQVSGGVNVAPEQIAGKGLIAGDGCQVDVNPGCGLRIFGDTLAVNPADLIGNGRGLKTLGPCGIEVNPGCGLTYFFDQVIVDAQTLAGHGLKVTSGSTCELRADLGCGLMFSLDGTGKIEINPFTIAGSGLAGNETDNGCKLDVKVGCGLWINSGGEVALSHDEIAGDGLTIGNDCELEVAVGCGLEVQSGGPVKVKASDLKGPGLKVISGCELGVDCNWIATQCGIEGERGPQGAAGAPGSTGPAGPQGATGATGAQGEHGGCATITATATCVENGQSCGVNVTQTGCDAQFAFTLAEGDQGPQGAQGAQGAQGSTGVTGSTGAQGGMGPTGPQGPQGAMGIGSPGPQGDQGAPGGLGPQGPQGFQGTMGMGSMGPQGPAGMDGGMGPQGPQGAPGMKMAIVPAAGEHVALFCVESPDIRFDDLVKVPITGTVTTVRMDRTYFTVCEPGTVEVAGVAASQPAIVGACIDGDAVVVRVEGNLPPYVTVRLSGIRRGYAGTRFPKKTRAQMFKNNAFWDQAR